MTGITRDSIVPTTNYNYRYIFRTFYGNTKIISLNIIIISLINLSKRYRLYRNLNSISLKVSFYTITIDFVLA